MSRSRRRSTSSRPSRSGSGGARARRIRRWRGMPPDSARSGSSSTGCGTSCASAGRFARPGTTRTSPPSGLPTSSRSTGSSAATVNPLVNDPFRALAHPIRRRIVERLGAGPATVGDATAGFGVSKPAISKHLKVLEESGVVTREVEGRTHRLSLEPDVLSEAADWMDRQRALWGRLFDVVDEYLKEEKD